MVEWRGEKNNQKWGQETLTMRVLTFYWGDKRRNEGKIVLKSFRKILCISSSEFVPKNISALPPSSHSLFHKGNHILFFQPLILVFTLVSLNNMLKLLLLIIDTTYWFPIMKHEDFAPSNIIMSFPSGSAVKKPPANTGGMGSIPGSERSLQKEMATHSSILAWEIPWTEEPGRLQSMGSQKIQTWLRD